MVQCRPALHCNHITQKDIAIFLCDITGHMAEPWVAAGYSAILVDPLFLSNAPHLKVPANDNQPASNISAA